MVTKFMSKFIIIHQITYVTSFVFSILCIFVNNIDTTTWTLFFNFAMPISTKSIWVWYLLLFAQCGVDLSYVVSMVAITSYFLCCCFYIWAICDHFDYVINWIDVIVEQNNIEEIPSSDRKVMEKMKEAIAVHNNAIE